VHTQRNFRELLEARWAQGKYLCVGFDPVWSKLPPEITKGVDKDNQQQKACRVYDFCRSLVDRLHEQLACIKPNSAFWEAFGSDGMVALEKFCAYVRTYYPELPIIGDVKRGDIGATNEAYRQSWLHAGFDAVTVHPYLGEEALRPILDSEGLGVFVLCRTSNPGAGEFQDFAMHHPDPNSSVKIPLYQHVARRVASWQERAKASLGLVTGATSPAELAQVRELVGPEMPLLIPGIGTQGGDLDASVAAAGGNFFIINCSSSVLYAYKKRGGHYLDAAEAEVVSVNEGITTARASLAAEEGGERR